MNLAAVIAAVKRWPYAALAFAMPEYAKRLMEIHVGMKQEQLRAAKLDNVIKAGEAWKSLPPEVREGWMRECALGLDREKVPPAAGE